MEQVLLIAFGWALGLLGGPLADSIRQKRRAAKLGDALLDELREFRHLMAFVAYRIAAHLGELDHKTLEWVVAAGAATELHPTEGKVLQVLKTLQGKTPQQLEASNVNRLTEGGSLSMKTYSLPLLESAVPELSSLPADLRRRLLDIREKVSLWNQETDFLMRMHWQTFEPSLTGPNRVLNTQNMQGSYRRLADLAHQIASGITATLGDASGPETLDR